MVLTRLVLSDIIHSNCFAILLNNDLVPGRKSVYVILKHIVCFVLFSSVITIISGAALTLIFIHLVCGGSFAKSLK